MTGADGRPLRVLHVFNRHRGGGGSDNAWAATIAASRNAGLEITTFERDSRTIGVGLGAKISAFATGIYARETVAAFDRTIAAARPDIVHTHELYPLISPWILPRASAAGIPVVHHCYDFRLTCPIATHARAGGICTECLDAGEHRAVLNDCRNNLAESAAYALRNAVARRFRLFSRHVSQAIALSPFTRDWLVDRAGFTAGQVTVNACVIPASAEPVDPARGGYVAYAGRFVPEKGVEVLIAAARRAGVPLRLAGDAPHHPAVRPGDDIACVTTRSPGELADFYRGARMLVVPSLWFETFAIVAAEAMAHGVPVIASDLGALADTVTRDVTGLLVPPGDVDALAAAIRRLWNDDALVRRLGAAAHTRVDRDFSQATHVDGLMRAYGAALRRRLPPGRDAA